MIQENSNLKQLLKYLTMTQLKFILTARSYIKNKTCNTKNSLTVIKTTMTTVDINTWWQLIHIIMQNSYQQFKRYLEERHTQTRRNLFKIFWQSQTSFSIKREWMYVNRRQRWPSFKIFCISFHVFVCAFPLEISSIFGKSFPFPFSYFVI